MKTIFLISFFFFSTPNSEAQTHRNFKLNASTVVKDSTGKIYFYSDWLALIRSKNYNLKPVNPADENSEFIIYKLTDQQKHFRDSLMASRISNTKISEDTKFFETGKAIKPFEAKDIDGNTVSLEQLKGKIIILNFWFIACKPCREEIPDLNKLVDKYKDNHEIVFIAIALDDKSSIKEFLQTNSFKYRVIADGNAIAKDTYGIDLYPTNIVVDGSSVVRSYTTGIGFGQIHHLNKSIEVVLKEKH